MNRKEWTWVGSGFCLLAAGLLSAIVVSKANFEDGYQEQLRLAWAEGIPTNGPEFQATITPASPADNAGPIYQQLKTKRRITTDLAKLATQITYHPNAVNRAAAKAALLDGNDRITLIEAAASLPRCNFQRDWSKGAGTLLPEYADMRAGARLIALRSSFAAADNRPDDAINDARRVFTIAKHAGEEPHAIARMVMRSIYEEGIQNLASVAIAHPDLYAYREELKKAIAGYPKPNLKEEYRGELFNILSMIDMCATPNGLLDLGVTHKSRDEKLAPLLHNRTKAREQIVQAERMLYKAFNAPPKWMTTRTASARFKLRQALKAFPTASDIFFTFMGDDPPVTHLRNYEARMQQYTALLRALQSPTIPRSMKAADLSSPFDGKPITYHYDSRQMVIEVSGHKNAKLELPPNP